VTLVGGHGARRPGATLGSTPRDRTPSGFALAYVIGTYPLPTTTFIDREIVTLRGLGVGPAIVSLRRPPSGSSREQVDLARSVSYALPVRVTSLLSSHLRFLTRRPLTYVSTVVGLAFAPHPDARARARTVLHFGLAVHVTRMLDDLGRVDHVHAHFVDRAALVALVAGRLLGIPYSATAHAADIYVRPILLPEKVRGSKVTVTCTRYNVEHLRSLVGAEPSRGLRCVYHGIDLARYRAPERRAPRAVPILLSVAQLKEKKGLDVLVRACRILADRGVAFECEIVGDGPLRSRLEALIAELELAKQVRLVGALPHDAVVERYAEAAAFVLPSLIASDGDRDGIPNVILEAMAMELPVVSTAHSGIPEAVQDGVTGLLVPPGDVRALAGALARVLADRDAGRLGAEGRRRVAERFDLERNVALLLSELTA
jgi:glycosyltransferase involved in cell wall biosynthesis